MTWTLIETLLVWPVFQAWLNFLLVQFHFPAHISHFLRAAFWNFAGSAICGIYVEGFAHTTALPGVKYGAS